MPTVSKKETYRGFNDALTQFLAADGPATLFYCREMDMCFTKTYPDRRNAVDKNSEYAGFEPLVSKQMAVSR